MDPKIVEQKITAIEAEMKRIGLWQEEPLPPETYDIHEAFGVDKMSFPQWLQFIFVPRVKGLIASNGPWPTNSQTGIYATQQFMFFRPVDPGVVTSAGSGDMKEEQLVRLLTEFDALFATPNAK